MKIKIDKEFHSLIPPLTDAEYSGLEKSIIAGGGCRDLLVVWQEKGILLDGHNRKRICDKHGFEYKTTKITLPNREAAADWIDSNQLDRRNLTPDQAARIRGRRCNRADKHPGMRTDLTSSQSATKTDAARQLAEDYGVSRATIFRDAQFATAADIVEEAVPELVEGIAKGTYARKDIIEASKTPEQAKDILEQKPHVTHNSGDNEWYTPAEYIELAREVMGGIDLDPASSAAANKIIKANKFFSLEDDGLNHKWAGRVWMNPPYAQPHIETFCNKLILHYESDEVLAAIVLVNNATETKWFQLLLGMAAAVCFPAGRVKFWHPDKVSAPLQGQAFVYFGDNSDMFASQFERLGVICFVRK